MLPFEDFDSLALLYHLNSEPWLNAEAYTEPYEVQYKEMTARGEPVPLPEPAGESALLSLLRERHSCRRYQARNMPLTQLATLLAGAYGTTRVSELAQGVNAYSRSVPSAGGLFPLEVYAAIQQVEGLDNGIYHYNVRSHSLEPVQVRAGLHQLGSFLLAQQFLENANVLILLSAVFERTLKKYGARGYRYILLEAGHAAQNLCLLAAEQGLGSLCAGGFIDSKLNRFLEFDGRTESVLYCIGIGYEREPISKQ
jgi:SagB-type dehydrogenase family enzyme